MKMKEAISATGLPEKTIRYYEDRGLVTPETYRQNGRTYHEYSWEDIETLLPALANMFETSIDLLLGMDVIRAKEARYTIHKTAHEFMRNGAYEEAERVYRDALLVYPNKPGMILGLGEALALQGKAEDAVTLMEKGLSLSENEKQKATIRAAMCFLYLQCGQAEKANALASELPHRRECREEIQPQIQSGISAEEIERKIHHILLGGSEKTW